jgi:hypothetical protein
MLTMAEELKIKRRLITTYFLWRRSLKTTYFTKSNNNNNNIIIIISSISIAHISKSSRRLKVVPSFLTRKKVGYDVIVDVVGEWIDR